MAEQLAGMTKEKVQFYSLDVKDADGKALAKKQGIDAIPTFILYEDGRETSRAVGPSPEELEEFMRGFVLIAKREEV